MIVIRRIGAVVLAVAAVGIWLFMAPADPVAPAVQAQEGVRDRTSEIRQALAEYDVNDARTQGAPQQTVVNGWIARDLLTIMAEQQNEALIRDEVPPPAPVEAPRDERIPALAGLVVVGLALAMLTTPRPAPRPSTAAADSPDVRSVEFATPPA